MQWAIVNDILHRCKKLHAERTRFEKHLGAAATNRVLNARSRKDAIAQLRSILAELENGPPSEKRVSGSQLSGIAIPVTQEPRRAARAAAVKRSVSRETHGEGC